MPSRRTDTNAAPVTVRLKTRSKRRSDVVAALCSGFRDGSKRFVAGGAELCGGGRVGHRMKLSWCVLVLSLLLSAPLAHGIVPVGVESVELTVDGVQRTALVYVPKTLPPDGGTVPLVFVWHGHGGTSANAVGGFGINRLWPEAISVYPQGLPTPGKLVDPEGKLPGWQSAVDGQGDRDLHFFDALLAKLKATHPVDPKRIYCTGHSNGAGFTCLLWRARPDVFAAVAPCSGAAAYAAELTPKPAMILGGKDDPLVKFEWQQRMMEVVKGINGCDAAGVPWKGGAGTLFASKGGTPLVTYVYPGGHMMVPEEAPLIVMFFREHPAMP